jgi:hypothetical protein
MLSHWRWATVSRKDGQKQDYATVQQPLDPPSASMGVDGEGSSSGVLEVMVKSEAKKSIVVYVVRCVG